jgi:KDO2-lipid IV(A) lauroyltransferase
MNLMALPLILGTGVDYGIFIQLALRRHHGSWPAAYRSVGRALLLCGGTAVAGFGSLAFSGNSGMSSLGAVCAVGITANMLIALLLLPGAWWILVGRHSPGADQAAPVAPSSLYRASVWRVGWLLVRVLPRPVCQVLARAGGLLYWLCAKHRRDVAIQNLLPATQNDLSAARRKARCLFLQFALKLEDLWRFETGLSVEHLFGESTGWDHMIEAQARKRGILLLTPHLGNWEFGAAWLQKRGVSLQVITMAEPGRNFTELRAQSRAKRNIETLVIGNDPFAFLEVIRRLEAGATVALLMDRPPPQTAVTVQLFSRPFRASIAAAELARASGCTLLPVVLPREAGAYAAHILPPLPYDRASLRDRKARENLTQAMATAFEPVIAKYADQWFHFVPIWPTDAQDKTP